MATILQFPVRKVVPVWGLTEQESDAVQAAASDLMLQGRSTGVNIHDEGRYMCVFDSDGKPYTIGREHGVCYLHDPDETMFARSQRFEIVLQALEILMEPDPDGAA
jgi:hypothetical protein